MENASKALVMAGGVLIGLMVIAVLLYTVQQVGTYKQSEEEQERVKQITEFNRDYESYDKKLMRGTDVVTVMNKAHNHNKNHEDATNTHVIATVTLTIEDIGVGNSIMKKNKEYSGETSEYQSMIMNSNALKIFKRKFFKCIEVSYNNETGFVNKLSFQEVDVGDIPDY